MEGSDEATTVPSHVRMLWPTLQALRALGGSGTVQDRRGLVRQPVRCISPPAAASRRPFRGLVVDTLCRQGLPPNPVKALTEHISKEIYLG